MSTQPTKAAPRGRLWVRPESERSLPCRSVGRTSTPGHRLVPLAMLLAAWVAACEHKPTKEEEEAARNTFACKLAGQRLVIRFDGDLHEVRMLTAAGEKVTLQQIPTASGVRYSNGNTELRGKGEDLTLIEFGTATKLEDCQPYSAPKS